MRIIIVGTCGRYTLARPVATAHNDRDFNWLKILGGHHVHCASLFSRGLHRDRRVIGRQRGGPGTPTPCPGRRLDGDPGVSDPRSSPLFLGRKASRFGRPAILPTAALVSPSPLSLPTMDLASRFSTSLGSRPARSRALFQNAPSAAALEPLATTTTSLASTMSALPPNLAALSNSGRPNSSAPASRRARGSAAPRASMPISRSI